MQYRQLGRSGLWVSELALGTNSFGATGLFRVFGSTDTAAAQRLVDVCLDRGVNLFDTADEYSDGQAERILGSALGRRRRDVLIATKGRTSTGPGPNNTGASRHHLIRACEASLRRLGTDHIDLYQLHAWDGLTPLEETLHALDTLIAGGKVRYVGICNYSAWHVGKLLATAERHRLQAPVCHHMHYSLHTRDAEHELLPQAVDAGLGVLVWSPLAGGLLSGKYRRDAPTPAGSRFAGDWNEPPVGDREVLYDVVDALQDVARRHDATPAQVALAWLLGRPAVSSLVIGARTEAQLAANLDAVDLQLTDEERQRLDDLTAPTLRYPHWHQAKIAADRLGPADLVLLDRHATRPNTERTSQS